MVPDWKALLPHRPLDPDTEQYVDARNGGGERIAQWLLAGRTTVLVAGPVGIGKSTELARAAKLLQVERAACLIRLDRFENMKRVVVDQILLRIAGQLVTMAISELKLPVSHGLRNALERRGVLDAALLSQTVMTLIRAAGKENAHSAFDASPSNILMLAVAEVAGLAHRRIALLLDGLEKLPEGPVISEVFEGLGMLSDDVDLVVVLPWSLAFGAGPDTILRAGEYLVTLRPPEVEGAPGEPGRTFLSELLARRLKLAAGTVAPDRSDRQPPTFAGLELLDIKVVTIAAMFSGGVPRTFLQLIADAGTYARMRRKDPWPSEADLMDAVADQKDSFRRILRRGDDDAIRSANGYDGRELELERKIRLLAHGVLLERIRGGKPVLTVHPLVASVLNS